MDVAGPHARVEKNTFRTGLSTVKSYRGSVVEHDKYLKMDGLHGDVPLLHNREHHDQRCEVLPSSLPIYIPRRGGRFVSRS
jgi:hypothetical protein